MAGEKEQEQQPEQEQEPVQEQTGDNQQQQSPSEPAAATPAAEAATEASSPSQTQQPRPLVHKTDFEQDVVYLYQFNRVGAVPSFSPFCLKVETWLRVAGVKYENVDHRLKHKSKKGQLPFIELNGKEVADSAIIIRELSKQYGKDLDEDLSAEQRSISHAFAMMLDNHTGWVYRWWWYNHPGDLLKSSKANLQHLLGSRIPNPFLKIFFKLRMKGKKKAAVGHGIGVHSAEEIYEFGKADFVALNELLGDKQFFFGDEPTLLDCVAFAHLVQVLTMSELEFPIKAFVESECSNLVALVDRLKERFWPDWEEMCKTLDLNTHLPKKEPESEEKKEKEVDKEKTGNGAEEKDKESEPDKEKEKVERDENEKEKDKEVDEGDNKQKEGLEEKQEENKKE